MFAIHIEGERFSEKKVTDIFYKKNISNLCGRKTFT